MITECPREPEIVAAVIAGTWPDGCSAGLRSHAGSCPVCAEVAEVASWCGGDGQEGMEPAVPSAAHVWWRVQMRARREAEAAAARPIAVVQRLAAAVATGLALAAIAYGWPSLRSALAGVKLTTLAGSPLVIAAGAAGAALVVMSVVIGVAWSETER